MPPKESITLYSITEVQIIDSTKMLKLRPLALLIANIFVSAPKNRPDMTMTLRQETAPDFGADHLNTKMDVNRTNSGVVPRITLIIFSSGPLLIVIDLSGQTNYINRILEGRLYLQVIKVSNSLLPLD